MKSTILNTGFITLTGRNIVTDKEVTFLTPVDIDFDAPVYYDESAWKFWMRNKNKDMVKRLNRLRKKW